MNKGMSGVSVPVVLSRLFIILAITAAISQPASAQTPPTHFRVDVSYGAYGQLFLSWDIEGTDTYVIQRSLSSGGPWTTILCGPQNNLPSDPSPINTQVCRDDNGGNPPLSPGTIYYYQVKACSNGTCSAYTQQNAGYTSNDPDASNCTNTGANAQIPNLTGFKPPPTYLFTFTAYTINHNVGYNPGDYERAACANNNPVTQTHQHILLVGLPGSGTPCGYSNLMYTAQNLGFDAICVNYDNYDAQEEICRVPHTSDSAHCFGNITQTKLDYTGDCILNGPLWTSTNCGISGSKVDPIIDPTGIYYVDSSNDAVIPRITDMLRYLCNSPSKYNQGSTVWGEYLSSYPNDCTGTPVWSKIILSGFSQGGDMATFAAYEYPVGRVINLSAPPQATLVNNVMTAASYFTATRPANIRSIFGLVSTNDEHYSQSPGQPPTSVYQAVWQALYYSNPASNDPLWLLVPSGPFPLPYSQGLNCNNGSSHNFANTALVKATGSGHDDPIYIWNEDIYEYMLLANTN